MTVKWEIPDGAYLNFEKSSDNNKLRIFTTALECIYYVTDFKLNCHVCGKTFSPLRAYLNPTDICDYFLDTWCKLYFYKIVSEDISKVCEHIKQVNFTWMYDQKDDMEHKILTESEIKKETKWISF